MMIWILGTFFSLIGCVIYLPVGIVMIALTILIPLFPLEGFKQPECVKTIYLIPLKYYEGRTTGEYISRCDNKITFAYDNREFYNIDVEAYEQDSVKGDIKIYKSHDCETPYLKIFKIRPEVGDIAVAPFSTKTQYVFCIPEKDKKDNPECNFKGDHTRIERLS